MIAHTPGPWRKDRHPSGEYVIDALDVGEYGIGFFALREDASVAAHAPELLAALTACVKAWEVNGNAEIPLREARALLDRMGDDA